MPVLMRLGEPDTRIYFQEEKRNMRGFILGTDWWTDCDDAVALRLMARAHLAGEIEIKGIAINACMECSVASLDSFLNGEGIYGLPLGIDLAATDFGRTPPYQARMAACYTGKRNNANVEDAVRLYRRILAESTYPIEVIEIGYLQVVAAVLESGPDDLSPLSGLELFTEKISKVWVMAGKWDENPGMENNFTRNDRSRVAGHVFCEKCPVPVTFLGWEVGVDVISGGALPEEDMLHLALCDHGSGNGRSSWDPMLCLLACVGDEERAGYDVVHGRAWVDPETGANYFRAEEKGLHAYVTKKRENAYYEAAIQYRISI